MSSAWYPYIRKTVMEVNVTCSISMRRSSCVVTGHGTQVCKRHGVRYAYYPSIFSNWASTLRYIAAAGRGVPSEPRVKRE